MTESEHVEPTLPVLYRTDDPQGGTVAWALLRAGGRGTGRRHPPGNNVGGWCRVGVADNCLRLTQFKAIRQGSAAP
jgi:hypothetical protein